MSTRPLDPRQESPAAGHDDAAEIYGLPVRDPEADVCRDPVELAATSFAEELRLGLRPAIDVYARRYPQHAQQIREILPLVAAMESWKSNRELAEARHDVPRADALVRLGNYRLLREIGRGGMGIVYEAAREPEGQRVAVKLLPPQFRQASQWRERFRREAATTANWRHPHVIEVYEAGQHGRWSYFVMQLIEGLGLDCIVKLLGQPPFLLRPEDILRGYRAAGAADEPGATNLKTAAELAAPQTAGTVSPLEPDSWHKIARIGAQVASALAYAHARHTLHRDIKPANLILDWRGSVYVADFGVALRHDQRATSPFEPGGTLSYIAPEQFDGQADERSDVFSLGATLYELCTLTPARDARSRGALIEQLRSARPPRPRHVKRGIPKELAQVIVKAMSHDPSGRFQSALDMLYALRPIGRANAGPQPGFRDPGVFEA
jgi:serine/threonine protein kinase